MINENKFIEHALIYDNYYGTSFKEVHNKIEQGVDIILEIDYQGAKQIKAIFPHAISIFIAPKNINQLSERIKNRNQNTQSDITKRLHSAPQELRQIHLFDYLIINDEFDKSVQELSAIFTSQRLTLQYYKTNRKKTLENITK